LRVRISTASGSERASHQATLATARGTDLARLPVHAIVNRSNEGGEEITNTRCGAVKPHLSFGIRVIIELYINVALLSGRGGKRVKHEKQA